MYVQQVDNRVDSFSFLKIDSLKKRVGSVPYCIIKFGYLLVTILYETLYYYMKVWVILKVYIPLFIGRYRVVCETLRKVRKSFI